MKAKRQKSIFHISIGWFSNTTFLGLNLQKSESEVGSSKQEKIQNEIFHFLQADCSRVVRLIHYSYILY